MLGAMETTTFLALLACLLVGLALGAASGCCGRAPSAVRRGRAAGLDQRAADQAWSAGARAAARPDARPRPPPRRLAGRVPPAGAPTCGTRPRLRRETQSLSTALRKPQVRGRWGELHLRRAVELAGLVDRCDFSEQVRLDDGARRPDLVVNLVGGRQVVVDAKVPARRLPRRHVDRRRPERARGPPGPARPAAAPARRPALLQAVLALAVRDARSSWCSSCRPSRSWPRRWRPTPA